MEFKISFIFVMFLTLTNCAWQNNPLGDSPSNSNYNPVQGNPPTTSFAVNFNKGLLLGPCGSQQEDLTRLSVMCFEVQFEREPLDFNPTHVSLVQPGSNATVSIDPTSDPLIYRLQILNYLTDGSEDGIYSIQINAGMITDLFGNFNLMGVSTDNDIELSQYVPSVPTLSPQSGGALAADSCQGLEVEVWSQNNISSLNSFFGGSPGLGPVSSFSQGLVDNLLNADHFEFRPGTDDYAFQWSGFIEIKTAGNYNFRTRSDDGSRFYLNNVLVVDNDGLHGAQTRTSASIALNSGIYPIKLQFFERGGGEIIEFTYAGPDTGGGYISPPSEVFEPTNCDIPVALDRSMIESYWTGNSPFLNGLVGLVREDAIDKHIKVSVDEESILKVNSGAFVDGSENLSSDSSSILIAHNNLSLGLTNTIGLTQAGFSWQTMNRVWRIQCDSGSDAITLQFDSVALDSNVDSIIFSESLSLTQNVKPIPFSQIGGEKAVTFRCSDFQSNVLFFTLGQYLL